MKALIISLVIAGLLLAGIFFISSPAISKAEENQYQGPVRPTDDEAYFRQTGITKPLEIEE
jgi:hypothetical protein